MGGVRGSFWGLCDRAGIQYPDSDTAAVLLFAVFDELGAVFEVWTVSLLPPPRSSLCLFHKDMCGNWVQRLDSRVKRFVLRQEKRAVS